MLSLLDGLAVPLRSVAIQLLANDAVRARAASLASACDMASRWTLGSTHQGQFQGIPETGCPVKFDGIEFNKVTAGSIVEH